MMFRARLRGAFVAIMTLAMLNAWYSMAQDLQPITSGFNGISPPSPLEVFGVSVDPYSNMIYWVNFGLLAVLTLGAKLLLDSKFGTVVQASRDDPERVRFLGYSVSFYQTVLFTAAALIAAIAGMLWVMTVQYVSPTSLETPLSIYMVIWAAVGGRHSLFGAMIGALVLNALQSYAGDELLTTWLIILGAIFILVVRFLPQGLAGLFEQLIGYIPYRRLPRAAVTRPATAE
jgi:urea transport system permease protein